MFHVRFPKMWTIDSVKFFAGSDEDPQVDGVHDHMESHFAFYIANGSLDGTDLSAMLALVLFHDEAELGLFKAP
jgi:hypothetical protein